MLKTLETVYIYIYIVNFNKNILMNIDDDITAMYFRRI